MGAFLDEIQDQALAMYDEAAGAQTALTLPEVEFARLVEEMGEVFTIENPETVTWVGIATVLVKPYPPRPGVQEPERWNPRHRATESMPS